MKLKYGQFVNDEFLKAFNEVLNTKLGAQDRVSVAKFHKKLIEEVEFGKKRYDELANSFKDEEFQQQLIILSNTDSELENNIPKSILDKVCLSVFEESLIKCAFLEE